MIKYWWAGCLALAALLQGCGGDDKESEPGSSATVVSSDTAEPDGGMAEGCQKLADGVRVEPDAASYARNETLIADIIDGSDQQTANAFRAIQAANRLAATTVDTPDFLTASGAFDEALQTLDAQCEQFGVDGVVTGS